MNEIFFIVEDAPEGGYTARAFGESIYTDADNLEELHSNVQDAVRCHFDEDKIPKMIRLQFRSRSHVDRNKTTQAARGGVSAICAMLPETPVFVVA